MIALVLVLAALVGLGALVGRRWVLVVPVLIAVALGAATSDDEALWAIGAAVALVAGLSATLFGLGLGRRLRGRRRRPGQVTRRGARRCGRRGAR